MRARRRGYLVDFYPTSRGVVDHCVDIIHRICDLRKAVVYDTSCGDGYFAESMGPDITVRSSDLIARVPGIREVDFLSDEFQLESADTGKELAFGFNPPYGHQNLLTRAFIRKMHSYSPRYMFLILPIPTRPGIQWSVSGYYTIYYEQLPAKSFIGPAGLDIPVVFAVFEFQKHAPWVNPMPRARVFKHPRVTRSPNKTPVAPCLLARYCGAGAGKQYYYLAPDGSMTYWDYGKNIRAVKIDTPVHVLDNATFTVVDLCDWDIFPQYLVEKLRSGALRCMNTRALRANFNTGDVARIVSSLSN